MKEDYSTRISKKIRNKLIYYTYSELKRKQNNKKYLLINSLSPNDLNNKYQKCSDYCVEKTETYTSSQMNNGIDNNNYFHVSVTYTSANDKYHMLVDNNNIEQYIGKNNIMGKYYKGNTIQIRTTTDNIKYKISYNQNKLEKQVIGEKKFYRHFRSLFSSLEITNNIKFMDNNEINEIHHMNNLQSNNNDENYKKIIKQNIHNEKIQTNCVFKIRKIRTLKMQNKFISKLKKYCATLIVLNRRISEKNLGVNSTNKMIEPSSPINDKKKKKIDKNLFYKSEKDKIKLDDPPLILNSNGVIFNNSNRFLHSNFNTKYNPTEVRNNSIHKKLKSQTKIDPNIFAFKIQSKRSFKKNRSIDKYEEKISPKKAVSPKKNASPKKILFTKKVGYSPKKGGGSPKKAACSPKKKITEFNTGLSNFTTKLSKVIQKFNKKEKSNDVAIRKFVSGNKMDIPLNKRKVNIIISNNNGDSKLNSNEKVFNSNIFRTSYNNSITKKGRLKKSLTINKKAYKFKGADLLEKKFNTNRNKEGNKY